MKSKILGLLAVGLLAGPMAANAGLITFDLTYSGAPFGNSAVGSGSITFDDAILRIPGFLYNVTANALGVTAFSITVSDASAGNGTFGLSDVTNWIWDVGAELDLTQNLVGQAGFFDFNWCGFDFIGCVAPAPGGVNVFAISTNAETGDLLLLTSMSPRERPVPEPGTLALLGLGLLGLGLIGAARPRGYRRQIARQLSEVADVGADQGRPATTVPEGTAVEHSRSRASP